MTATRHLFPISIALATMALPAMPGYGQGLPAAMRAGKADYCVECHGRLKGRGGIAVSEWKKSVHAGQGENCNLCHGGNPDMADKNAAHDARLSFVGKAVKDGEVELCGRAGCHGPAMAVFRTSPHYGALKKSGKPGCVTCHGSHNIQKSRVAFIKAEDCTACHPAGDVEKVLKSMAEIEADIGAIEKNAAYLLDKNAESRDITEKLLDVKILYHSLVHVMSTREVQFTRKEIELLLRDLRAGAEMRVLIAKRLDLIYFVTIALSFLVVISFMVFTVRAFSRKKE